MNRSYVPGDATPAQPLHTTTTTPGAQAKTTQTQDHQRLNMEHWVTPVGFEPTTRGNSRAARGGVRDWPSHRLESPQSAH
jgi:hypothetical protein